MDESHKLQYLLKQYDNYKAFRSKNYDHRFIENYRLYKCFRDGEMSGWQSNVFLPYAFSVIETVFPRIMEYVYQGDKFVSVIARGPEDEGQASTVDKLIQYQIDTQIRNLFMELAEQYKSTLIFGTGIGKLTQNVAKRRPEFSNIDILDFVPQPYKKYIDDMDGMYHVYDKYVDSLWQQQQMGIEGYRNIDKITGVSQTRQTDSDKSNMNSNSGKDGVMDSQRNTALIYEYWGKVPVQDRIDLDYHLSTSYYEEKMVLIANREYIIREIPNPYITPQNPEGFKPFIASKNYIDPNEFYAIGEIDVIKDMQHMANELKANALDNLKLIINSMWHLSSTAGVDLDTVYSHPGGIIITNKLDDMQPLVAKDLPQSYYKEMEDNERMIDKTTGVFDYTRGGNAPGMTDTVGGISQLVEEANMRFAIKIKILQTSSISDFARKLFMLDQIFIKGADLSIRIEGPEGAQWMYINPDNLAGQYDFKAVGATMIGNKLAQQNALIKLGELFSKFPPIPPLAEQILEKHDIKNKDQIMQYLHMMWGIPPEGAMSPPMPAGGQPGGIPLRPGQPGPPVNNMQMNQNLSRQLAAGMR